MIMEIIYKANIDDTSIIQSVSHSDTRHRECYYHIKHGNERDDAQSDREKNAL